MSDRLRTIENVARIESEWRSSSTSLDIVVAGKFRSGKTELVNAMCGIQIKENNDTATKILRNNSHDFEDKQIKIWDTCGMYQDSVKRKSDLAIKTIQTIKCMRNGTDKILLYTIPINQARFLEDVKQNVDINCLKRFNEEFGANVWKHAIIVFTYVNNLYEEVEDELEGETSEDLRETFHSENIGEWEKIVRNGLEMALVPREVALQIPVVLAGYVRHERDPSRIKCDAEGNSWVWSIWQKIIEISPNDYKFQLLDHTFSKICGDPFLYADSYLSYVRLYGELLKQKASEAQFEDNTELCEKLGLSYTYLRLLKKWFDNYALSKKSLKCSKDAFSKFGAWRSMVAGLEIVVAGREKSGKSELIKSMLSSKIKTADVVQEGKKTVCTYKNIRCTIQEVLIGAPPQSLDSIADSDSSVVIICIPLSETKENITRILRPIVEKQPQNVAVALTYADDDSTRNSWTEVTRSQSSRIKDALRELQLNENAVKNLQIAPAGYQLTINADPAKKSWVMDVWLKSIESSKVSHQPALMIFLNHFVYGGKKLKIEPEHKEKFRECFLDLLYSLIPLHNIDF